MNHQSSPSPSITQLNENHEVHPNVRAAVHYVEQHLTDPALSVAGVARELDTNATYLGHLFAQQMGIPMRRFIIRNRLELAKDLLGRTDWQIKRVAYETGHKNADWFSHVFHVETGYTPREFRAQVRSD